MNNILNVAVLAILILSTLWGIVFKKHVLLRLICVGARAVLAFMGTMYLKADILASTAEVQTIVTSTLGAENALGQAIANSEVLTEVFLNIIASLSSTLVFLVLYFVLGIAMFVFRFIVGLIIRPKKHLKFLTRAVLGFVQGLIIVTCILVPVSTFAGIADTALPDLKESGIVSEEVYKTVNAPLSEINDSAAVKTYRTLGGKMLSESMTNMKIKVDGKAVKVKFNTEIKSIVDFFADVMSLTKVELANYTEKETQILEHLGDSLTKSKVLGAIVSEVIGDAAEAWDKGEAYMGMEKPALDPTFDPLIHKTISILGKDSGNITYLKEDINTFAAMVSKLLPTLAASGGEGGEGVDGALLAKDMVKDLFTVINTNPRMRPLIPVITNIGIKMVTDSLGIDATSADAYNRITEDIAAQIKDSASLNDDARQGRLEETMKTAFARHELTISDEEISIIAMAMLEHFDGVSGPIPTQVTADDVSAFLTEMTEVVSTQDGENPVAAIGDYGMTKLSNGTSSAALAGQLIANICDVQSNSALSPAEKEESIAALISASPLFDSGSTELSDEKLNAIKLSVIATASRNADESAKALITIAGLTPHDNSSLKNTAAVLLIDIEAFENADVTEAEMLAIIDSVAQAFDSLDDLSSSLGGENPADTLGAMCEALGEVLDSFSENEKFYGKDKTDKLMGAILKSDTVTDATGLSKNDINNLLDAKNDKNVSYSALMGTVSETADTLASIEQGSALTTETVGELVDALTAENSGAVIAAVITPEKLQEIGFTTNDPEDLNYAADVLKAIFTNVSEAPAESRDQEVEAVKNIVALVSDANIPGTSSLHIFGPGARLDSTAGEVIDTIVASEAVSDALGTLSELEPDEGNPFGISLSDEDENEVRYAINQRLDDPGADTEALYNIAIFLGVTL